jgi:hypothetical protein
MRSGRTFQFHKVRFCTFAGQKLTSKEVTLWVTELVQLEQAEWLDSEKKNFRLSYA